MSILPIRTVPDPVLRTQTPAVAVSRFATVSLRTMIQDMFDTMTDVEGVGLAAPQIGISLQVFVFDVDGRRGHVINPSLQHWGETVTEPGEGCLSVPGLHYLTPRSNQAEITGVTVDGEPVAYAGEGLFARCLQHEFDHLNATLFVDRLVGEERRSARRRMAAADYSQITSQTHHERSASLNSSFGSPRQSGR